MEYQNGKMTGVRVAYIGGGSRGWAWTFMTDLALEPSLCGTICLYDIDHEAAEHNAVIGNSLARRPEATSPWHYETAATLDEALTGADFVIISILPKTFDEMAVDVHLPERLGIWQSVGDTAGPGGIIRGLRTIPMFVEIAQAVRRCCPQAWVINYTNPMSLCVAALYDTFPEIRAFGCCHEVFGTQKVLAGIAAETLGLPEIPREEICVNVLGLNHFTWFDAASWKGIDLFPIYRRYAEAHRADGYAERDANWMNASFGCRHRVKFDLFLRYGWIAAAGDRHLAEFMPGNTYLRDPETVASWDFGLTTVDWRKQDLQNRLARSRRLLSGEEQLPLKPTGEEGVQLMKALCGLSRKVSNVNIPNRMGQIANLPRETVVETNALFERGAVRPLEAGSLKPDILELVRPHAENQRRVLQAAKTRDEELVVQAFANDPLVKGRATEPEIRALVHDMMAATL